jgi:putative membrane protein
MGKPRIKTAQPKSLAKGLLAGLIGGLAGVLAMAAAERLIPRRARPDSGAPELAAGISALDGMHWSFGAAVGAAYGAVAEYFPASTAQHGVAFGMAVETLDHEGTLPALGLLTGSSPRDSAGLTSHVVYGVTTETVRHFVRKRL